MGYGAMITISCNKTRQKPHAVIHKLAVPGKKQETM